MIEHVIDAVAVEISTVDVWRAVDSPVIHG
jgi:hypothetical protein